MLPQGMSEWPLMHACLWVCHNGGVLAGSAGEWVQGSFKLLLTLPCQVPACCCIHAAGMRRGVAAESDAGTSDLSSEYDECMSEMQAGDHTSHATSAVNSPLLGQGGRRARHGSSVSGAKAQQQGLGSGDQQQGPHQQGSGSSIHNRGGLQGLGSSSEGAVSSLENSGPVLPSAPLINHTPITATRLENFRTQLEGEPHSCSDACIVCGDCFAGCMGLLPYCTVLL
jgi:hypothetical protein